MELAATRLIAMRKNKGKSIAACLHDHTSYIQNPDKTCQQLPVQPFDSGRRIYADKTAL